MSNSIAPGTFSREVLLRPTSCYRCRYSGSDRSYAMDNRMKKLHCNQCAMLSILSPEGSDSTGIMTDADIETRMDPSYARERLRMRGVLRSTLSADKKEAFTPLMDGAEELMWMDAKSIQEYTDSRTLHDRLRKAAAELQSASNE